MPLKTGGMFVPRKARTSRLQAQRKEKDMSLAGAAGGSGTGSRTKGQDDFRNMLAGGK